MKWSSHLYFNNTDNQTSNLAVYLKGKLHACRPRTTCCLELQVGNETFSYEFYTQNKHKRTRVPKGFFEVQDFPPLNLTPTTAFVNNALFTPVPVQESQSDVSKLIERKTREVKWNLDEIGIPLFYNATCNDFPYTFPSELLNKYYIESIKTWTNIAKEDSDDPPIFSTGHILISRSSRKYHATDTEPAVEGNTRYFMHIGGIPHG